ncbi:rod shape-determining protein [Candidatus Uhrbacteria bacterium]|jgi:rod shape-determining protein MreB and related proteins|nr:rod shape-determining protein [Candidatus Uhrbacteria bacterium]
MLKQLLGKFSKDLGIDLGTSNTLVFSQEKGLVINEPSVVAVNTRTGQILAVGRDARNMIDKTPPHILTTRPLVKAVISDFEVTEKLLKHFIDAVHHETFTLMPRPRVVIGVPLEITEVERKAVEDAVLSAGAREVFLVEKAMAAAIGARLPVMESVGSMIVDLGGGTTEIAAVSLGGVVTWKALHVAGEELNKNIVQYARDTFNLLIGDKVAEDIKMKIGSAITLNEPLVMPMRGRDLISGLPREIIANDTQIREAMHRSIKFIIDNIKQTLEMTPPELVADIYERGIVLTGGGALLNGLAEAIAKEIAIPVRIADDPMACVARGAGALLDKPELLRGLALPSATDGRQPFI